MEERFVIANIECEGGVCRIVERLPSKILNDINFTCSYEIPGLFFMKQNLPDRVVRKMDDRVRLFDIRTRRFPIGLLPLVRARLKTHDVEILSTRDQPDLKYVNYEMGGGFKMRDYQEEAAEVAVKEQIATLRVATGGGKTVIAGRIIEKLGLVTLFMVHTKDLLYQAKEMFSVMFGGDMVGQIGDGIVDLKPITVGTIQTISRAMGIEYHHYEYEDIRWEDEADVDMDAIPSFLDDVGLVFMDECHRVASDTAMSIMAGLRTPKYRVGLSASPWRDDGADLAIQACLGAVEYSRNATKLTEDGFLVPAIIRMLPVPPMRIRGNYDKVYRKYITDNETRNQMGVDAAIDMVKRDFTTMVLVRYLKHGRTISKMLSEQLGFPVPFLSGKDSSKVRNATIQRTRDGDIPILVASTIADEGLDIKPLRGLVLMGGGKSSVKALQRIGRTLRPWPGKGFAEIVDFYDKAKYLISHSSDRENIYQTEDAWTIIDV